MAEQIRRYDGTVVQLRGDELYAIFGAPVAHEDDSERAVRAALAMQRAVGRTRPRSRPPTGSSSQCASGSTRARSSSARARTATAQTRGTRSATRSTSRRASRTSRRPAGVVLGSTTARQVESVLLLEELGEPSCAAASGRCRPSASRASASRRAGPVPDRPLVGRDFELTVLERTMDGLVEGRGVIVSIIGRAGIGKTPPRRRDPRPLPRPHPLRRGPRRLVRPELPLLADPRPPARLARRRRLDA